jgi:putative transposase
LEGMADMKFKYRNREFWCRGYYVDTAGKDAKKIKEYIQKQLKEDELSGQLMIEDTNSFTGGKK